MKSKFLNWGLCKNYWGWSHALAGGIVAGLLHNFLSHSKFDAVVAVLFGACIWEAGEYFWNIRKHGGFGKNYREGGREQFLYDAAGDIFLAVSFALITMIG